MIFHDIHHYCYLFVQYYSNTSVREAAQDKDAHFKLIRLKYLIAFKDQYVSSVCPERLIYLEIARVEK